MHRHLGFFLAIALTVPTGLHAERAASLRGSPASMQEQNRVAKEHRLTFYRTPAEIRAAAARGDLVELKGNEDYFVADFVQYPYLRAEAALFVERLAAQYREACGQKLVVTSGVRPSSGQPSNAHALSVHPAGMAVDLRVSDRAECRSWLENAILNLERRGVLNGIREYRPPHYHIAIYPDQYAAYAQGRMALEAEAARANEVLSPAVEPTAWLTAAGASALAGSPDAEIAAAGEGSRRSGGLHIALAAVVLGVPFGLGYRRIRRR